MMKKILIVDDDRAILEALAVAIEDAGYKVATEASGDGVVEKVKDFSPDLILLDFLLPGANGIEVARCLKRERATKDIPVILISAHLGTGKAAKELGVDDFMAKPFDIEKLLAKIGKYLQ